MPSPRTREGRLPGFLTALLLALAGVVPIPGNAREDPDLDRVLAIETEELAARLLSGAVPDPSTPPHLHALVRHRFVSPEVPWFLELHIGLFEAEEEAGRTHIRTMPSAPRGFREDEERGVESFLSSNAVHLHHRNLVVVARRCEREPEGVSSGEEGGKRSAKPPIEELLAWQDRLVRWLTDSELKPGG